MPCSTFYLIYARVIAFARACHEYHIPLRRAAYQVTEYEWAAICKEMGAEPSDIKTIHLAGITVVRHENPNAPLD